MAIVKIINRQTGKAYAVKAVLDYIQNPIKTENGLLCSAKDCLLECAYDQMLATKLDYHQDTGRQYIHIVQSFSEFDKLDSKTAHEIGKRLLAEFKGFQGVVCTHTDRKQLHNHIVLNSVNWQTGRKWQSGKRDLYRLRELSDRLCKEYGLSIIGNSQSWQASGEYRAGENSWKYKLAQDIAACLQTSFSRQDFLHRMNDIGLDADFGRRNVIFFVRKAGGVRYGLDKEVSCGNTKLSTYGDFSKENLESAWKSNSVLADLGRRDVDILQDVLREVGALHHPENPGLYEQMYLADIDFEGMTKLEIEIALAQRTAIIKAKQALEEYERQHSQKANLVLPTLDALVAEIVRLYREREQNDYTYNDSHDNEYEYEI
ncbi:MAG: relaxase/mobilization nuclease domain-containing protein [Lachnospiraceae bacterium]|nr:relaxase/mobilization nuclease domain-containing protein [Lachnospiraceae bacterium]